MHADEPPTKDQLIPVYLSGIATGLETLKSPAILLDSECRVQFWNMQAETQTGWDRQEVIGKHVCPLILDERSWAIFKESIGELNSKPTESIEIPTELSIHRRKGRPFPAALTVTRMLLGVGQWTLIVIDDVTALQRMERYVSKLTLEARLLHEATTLASESESFEQALQHCVDITCEVTSWDVGMIYLLDEKRDVMVLASGEDVATDGELLRRMAGHERTRQEKSIFVEVWWSGEFRWRPSLRPDADLDQNLADEFGLHGVFAFPVAVRGKVLAILQFFSKEEIEPDPQLLLMVRNLSSQLGRVIERKRALDQDARLAAIVDSSSDAIISRDISGSITSWNTGAEKIYGYTAEEAIGQTIDIIIIEGRKEDEELRVAMETACRLDQLLVERRRKNGSRLDVSVTLSPVTDEGGVVTGWATIERDMTETVRSRDALRVAKDAAEAASLSKNEFLANISHELRTPMNAIIGMTDLALEDSLSPETRENLSLARSAADSLSWLLSDLLDFSRMEAGRFELELDTFQLRPSIDELMKLLVMKAAEKDIELVYRIDDSIPSRVVGDEQRLRQILVNLIGNAIKFTDEGEVSLNVRLIKQTKRGVHLQFSVRDTGIGIPKKDHLRIFESFRQADSSMTRRHGGTGLGLAITSKLIQLMDGNLSLISGEGEGSTFTVDVHFGLEGTQTADDEDLSRVLEGARVLLLDDNLTNRENIEEILVRHGAVVTSTEDGHSALSEISSAEEEGKPFSLVFVDALMPEMDGPEFVRRFRIAYADHSRLIVMVSPADRRHVERRLPPATSLLAKPVSRRELLAAIRKNVEDQLRESDPEMTAYIDQERTSLRILVAEDTIANQRVVQKILDHFGHAHRIVSNGQSAVDAIEREEFDLILMDVQMPIMDGLQATAVLRAHPDPRIAEVPILAMTAYARAEDRDRCLAAGMDGYISKPFDLRELDQLLCRYSTDCQSAHTLDPESERRTATHAKLRPTVEVEPSVSSDGVMNEEVATERLGSTEMFIEMCEFVTADADSMLEQIRDAFNDGDHETGERIAHSMKSVVANVEAVRARNAALEVERAYKKHDESVLPNCIELLARETKILLKAIERRVGRER